MLPPHVRIQGLWFRREMDIIPQKELSTGFMYPLLFTKILNQDCGIASMATPNPPTLAADTSPNLADQVVSGVNFITSS